MFSQSDLVCVGQRTNNLVGVTSVLTLWALETELRSSASLSLPPSPPLFLHQQNASVSSESCFPLCLDILFMYESSLEPSQFSSLTETTHFYYSVERTQLVFPWSASETFSFTQKQIPWFFVQSCFPCCLFALCVLG